MLEEQLRTIAYTLLRFTVFSAHAYIFGLILVLVFVLRPTFASLPEEWGRGRRRLALRLEGFVRASLIASVVGTALIILLQSALTSELTTGEVSSDSLISVLETRFGQWQALRLPLLAALGILLVGRVKEWALAGTSNEGGSSAPSLVWWTGWGVLSLALLATSTFSGHAAVVTPGWLAATNDLLHQAAASVWFAGVVVLGTVLPDGWMGRDRVDRLDLLAPVVTRFSKVALVSITLVALTGTLNSFLHVEKIADFWEASYGRSLGLKILLFLGILALGGVNHYFVRGKLAAARETRSPSGSQRLFRRTIGIELAIALSIMLLTGLLVGLARTKPIETEPPDTAAFLRQN
ncbi:MAG: copper resistance D family protein [Actinomycetota bacterium]